MIRLLTSILAFLVLGACVDRLQYDIPSASNHGISVDGFISNEPGPYRINISRVFDIDSKDFPKVPISAKKVTLSDNEGIREELTEISDGVYETNAAGIQGQVGNVYTLKIELLNGNVYESLPDTLLPAGKMDSVYYKFVSAVDPKGATQYGFDIFANSSRGANSKGQFSWNMMGTYQAETHPECFKGGCFYANGKCNFVLPCSGVENIGGTAFPEFEKTSVCSCCTCWYNVFNEKPLLSDSYFSSAKHFNEQKIFHVPLNGWTFMHKMRVLVKQQSLTDNTFRFWKSVKDQQAATGSLFQPVSGKVPVNFNQLSGADSPVQGLFYAVTVSSKSLYIYRSDVPSETMIPVTGPGCISCLDLAPHSTNIKPSFWED